ncbi:MAG: dienelactone hydrolase family protein [Desulfomonilaceae bacterium]
MKRTIMLFSMMLWPTIVFAEPQTQVVEYKDGNTILEGYLAAPKVIGDKKPGILIVPDWMGVRKPYKDIADRLADMGYIAFVADIYGKDVRPSNNQEAATEATKYKSNRKLMRQRVLSGLNELKKDPNVDQKRIAAIGYCFGGTTVLELARAGAPVVGVVSFHGGLDSPSPQDGKNIKAKILILHGADDPLVSAKDIAAFQQELRNGGVDWQMIYYGDAVHSFTQPTAGNDKSIGTAYNERADKRSWEAMKQFFREIFQEDTAR